MRARDPVAQQWREQSEHISERLMVRIVTRARTGSDVESLALWTGRDDRQISAVDMNTGLVLTDTFRGVQGALDVGEINHVPGLAVPALTIKLTANSAEVERAVQEYSARGAPVQVWTASLHPQTGQFLGVPEGEYVGTIDKLQKPNPAPGGSSAWSIRVVSSARSLQLTGDFTRTHARQKLRSPGDKWALYGAIVGSLSLDFGQKPR